MSELVGCGRSTVGMVVDEVVEAIVKELWEEHVSKHFPKTEEQIPSEDLRHRRVVAVPVLLGGHTQRSHTLDMS